MVYIDTPRTIYYRGSYRRTVHCVADSLDELHTFAKNIKVPRRLFENKPGKPHYDLFDDMIERAINAGALVVARREIIEVLERNFRK